LHTPTPLVFSFIINQKRYITQKKQTPHVVRGLLDQVPKYTSSLPVGGVVAIQTAAKLSGADVAAVM